MNEIRHALNVERRKRYLENLIKEAIINTLAEQEQAQPVQPTPPAQQTAQLQQTPVSQPIDTSGTVKPEEQFTVDDLIERLNLIRAGRSFTDPEVYGQLVTYFKTLTDQQKMDIQNILIALGKIVMDVADEPVQSLENSPPPQPQQPVQMTAPPQPAAMQTSNVSAAPVAAVSTPAV